MSSWPHTRCSTLAVSDFMRVPRPAASTTTARSDMAATILPRVPVDPRGASFPFPALAEDLAGELAALADCAFEAAIEWHAKRLALAGAPLTAAGKRCRFVVFGMGKLGGEELNFSSDVDVIYLYETDAGAAGARTLHEYFARLC